MKTTKKTKALLGKLGKAKANSKPVDLPVWTYAGKDGKQHEIKIDARIAVEQPQSMKERAVAYIEASLVWRRAELARLEAHRELQLELGPKTDGGMTPTDMNNYLTQRVCVTRLEEVLGVLRSAP